MFTVVGHTFRASGKSQDTFRKGWKVPEHPKGRGCDTGLLVNLVAISTSLLLYKKGSFMTSSDVLEAVDDCWHYVEGSQRGTLSQSSGRCNKRTGVKSMWMDSVVSTLQQPLQGYLHIHIECAAMT